MDENTNAAVKENATDRNVAEPAQSEAKTARPTFDDLLKDGYQAEFDRRVTKAIETAKGKFTDPKVGELEKRLDGYIRREAILKAGVRSEFVDYVQYAVGNAIPDGETFEAALEGFLKEHAQFTAASEPAKAWSQPMQPASATQTDGVEAAFKKLNPNLKLE